jgi:hypothetical protein
MLLSPDIHQRLMIEPELAEFIADIKSEGAIRPFLFLGCGNLVVLDVAPCVD